MFEAPSISKLQEAIASPDNPIGMRMRAAYYLRQAYENYKRNKDNYDDNDDENDNDTNRIKTKEIDEIVIETLSKGLQNEKHGSLMRHEFAYVMGQIRDERSCHILEKVLLNKSDCIMVRHECGEALGAISSTNSIPILHQAMDENPNQPEIYETCSLAISFIKWKLNGGVEGDVDQPMVCACMLSPYSSVDPAPPHPSHVSLSTKEIGNILHDPSHPIFERYRAMFSLRNRGTLECVQELGHSLIHDKSSALLRHEIAYVLGQMQSPDSIEALRTSLQRKGEHIMVRHESAEALGAIEERWDEVEAVLKSFLDDDDVVVKESCIVALDAADYWGRGEKHDCCNDDINSNNDRDGDLNDLSFAKQKAQPVS